MKLHLIKCDQCRNNCKIEHISYGERLLVHATYEGARSDWDFCSHACFATWFEARRENRAAASQRFQNSHT